MATLHPGQEGDPDAAESGGLLLSEAQGFALLADDDSDFFWGQGIFYSIE